MVRLGNKKSATPVLQRHGVSNSSKDTKKQRDKRLVGWDDKALFWCVIAATIAVLVSLSTLLWDSPKEIAEKEMKYLADEYYLTYLYPRLLGNYQPEEILPEYAESGVATTYLRQMLLFNDGEYADSKAKFTHPSYNCDVNLTGVRFFPREPYGPHDYEMSYIWHCKDQTEEK